MDDKFLSISKRAIAGLFSAMVLLLLAGGYGLYRYEALALQKHQYDDLKAVADLKVNQIVRWRKERISDAAQNSAAPFLRSAVIQWSKTPEQTVLKTRIKTRLQLLKDAEGYENVILADLKGKILLTLNPSLSELETVAKQLVHRATLTGQPVLGDFFRCPHCNQVFLDVAAPILNQGKKPVAVLILRTDPLEYLYPLIQSWPTASPSAETLLIRKEANDVLFLNVLRHRAHPALSLRIPLTSKEVPAVQGISGRTGIFEGRDYRGVPVLADIRSIPGSSWFMVAKMDRKEVLSEAMERARLIGFLTLAMILLAGMGTALIYKRQGKKTLEVLQRNEERIQSILKAAPTGIGVVVNRVFTEVNQKFCEMTGYKREELIGRSARMVYPSDADFNYVGSEKYQQITRQGTGSVETRFKKKSGELIDVLMSSTPINPQDLGQGVTFTALDITERKEAEKALKTLSFQQEALLSAIPDIIMEVDQNKVYTWANQAGYAFFGKEVIGKEAADFFEGEQDTYNRVQPLFQGDENVIYLESWQRRKDGQKRLLAWWCRVLKDENGQVRGALSSARDITEQKLAEEALRESEERYRQLVENANEAIFVAQDERVCFYNPKTTELMKYGKGELPERPFTDFIHPQDREMVLERHRKRIKGEDPWGTYPFRIIDREGTLKWVELNSTRIVWEGRPATLNFISDISERKKAEERIIEGANQLQKAVEGIVLAMAATVEAKDPYTAGHQRRVAVLARAVAAEMGYPADRIQGIHMAGMIHDLGKMSIPGEILSKPSQLSELEMRLIRMHPQAGYDVLKDIDFPWPLAEIVLQHHERVNGSGYPKGLKGDGIMEEAKILAVADVVEAIASHRPYRPAHGLDKALEEIEKQKGILYDAEVVEHCLRLFREKNFQLT
jgi:PAS domain S-box-containing protein